MECIHRGLSVATHTKGEIFTCSQFGTCTLTDLGFKKQGVPLATCVDKDGQTCPRRIDPNAVDAMLKQRSQLAVPEGGDPRRAFQRVVIINLERRTDRLKQIMGEIAKDWPFVSPIIMKGIDGEKLKAPANFKQGNNVWACLQSHRRAIEDAINDGIESLLVLEDDAIFHPQFSERALKFLTDIPGDWEFAFLGGGHIDPAKPPIAVKPGIVRPQNIQRLHAYAARREGLHALYQYWHEWHEGHCDHAISTWIGTRKTYCVQPWIVGQRAGLSDVRRYEGTNVPAQVGEDWFVTGDHAVINKPGDVPSLHLAATIAPAIPLHREEGIGTELSNVLKKLFNISAEGCGGCQDMIRQMNCWGEDGCRENRETILARLREKISGVGWMTAIALGFTAIRRGGIKDASSINPLDPAPGILDLAIKNFKDKQTNSRLLSACMASCGLEDAARSVRSFYETTAGHDVEMIVVPHVADPIAELLEMQADTKKYPNLLIDVSDRPFVDRLNLCAKKASGKWMMVWEDDFVGQPEWLNRMMQRWRGIGEPETFYMGLPDADNPRVPGEIFTTAIGSRRFFVDFCGAVLVAPTLGAHVSDQWKFDIAQTNGCAWFCPDAQIDRHSVIVESDVEGEAQYAAMKASGFSVNWMPILRPL